MMPLEQPGKLSGDNLPISPYLPAQTIDETTLLDLPVLTEVVAQADTDMPRILDAGEIQQLLGQLEKHIETLFTQKLALQLEQMQRLAIDHALDELKAELPGLLRNALNAPLDSR